MNPWILAWSLAAAADAPVELGRIGWRRDYDDAAARAAEVGRPLLVLFDEVPGCSTVRAFGAGALSHPLLVEAAETLFVPVFVQNNTDGDDRRILEQFGEPAWNNPAVRFLDPGGAPVGARLYGDWTEAALAEHMVAALGAQAPPWLVLVAEEERARIRGTEPRLFGMYCFWSGEAALGGVPGVVGARTGFVNGSEAVELTVDPRALDGAALAAAIAHVGARPVSGAFRPSPGDDRHVLDGTPWAGVPMRPAQAARVVADVGAGVDPSRWFSPRERVSLGLPSNGE